MDIKLDKAVGFHTMLNILEPDPVFTQYVERCLNREAAKRSEVLDNALFENNK